MPRFDPKQSRTPSECLRVFLVPEGDPVRLDLWLSRQLPDRARNQIQKDIVEGRVRVGGEVQAARYRLQPGERVEYDVPPPTVALLRPQDIALNIVYEDDDMLVIDKPAGLVVHPAPGHAEGTLVNALLAHCGPALEGVGGEGRWGIVHRLDADTSGLILAARTQPAYEALVKALAARRVRRQYLGLSLGILHATEGTIDHPIGRRTSDRKRMGVREDGRPARTDWRVLWQADGVSLLALTLHTGRTHQIRVHLQSIGHPVIGDTEYGWTRPRALKIFPPHRRAVLSAVWPARQLLHAARLRLRHPLERDRVLAFNSAPPADFQAVLDALWAGQAWPAAMQAWLEGQKPGPAAS